ncbi:hypothetical protein GCM10010429_23350 [Micromonospora olivasterospora]|uniref:Uncharacterized protein n=1 Tax=Micromonospora olivasterospora TaxID=1880 RepID=A0A562HU25_MICOL|nr:hypothetical protein JD77_06320 [Micromonospora olivasterospora]
MDAIYADGRGAAHNISCRRVLGPTGCTHPVRGRERDGKAHRPPESAKHRARGEFDQQFIGAREMNAAELKRFEAWEMTR